MKPVNKITVEDLEKAFSDLFYNRIDHTNTRIWIFGTKKQLKKLLKTLSNPLNESSKTV